MGRFLINGNLATEGDFRRLSSAFEELSGGSFEFHVSSHDDELAYEEIVRLIDSDDDGKGTYADLRNISAAGFGDLNSILKKYGLDPSFEIAPAYGKAIYDVPWGLWSSKEFALMVVERVPGYLQFVDPVLQDDPDVVLAAVRNSGTALKYASLRLRDDPCIVRAAVEQDGMALQYAGPKSRADRDIVLIAVKEDYGAFKYADPLLQKDRDFMIMGVKNGVYLPVFDGALFDREILAESAEICIGILLQSRLDVKDVAYAWGKIRNKYSKRLRRVFKGRVPKNFSDFNKALKRIYDIEFLERFRSIDTLLGVLELRLNPGRAVGKTAVVISPKVDGNGAFDSYPVVDRLRELGFTVLYYEVGDEGAAIRALKHATMKGKRKADVVVIEGHGSASTLSLGGEDLGAGGKMSDEFKYIDSSDVENGRDELRLKRFIKQGGDLVLNSCSNGEGFDRNRGNLANRLAEVLPGIRIQSATEPMNVKEIYIDLYGRPIFQWTAGTLYVRG